MSTPSFSFILHNGTYRTRYLFNGKELDTETNLYYYGARYFEPNIAVWYGVDPLAEKYPFNSAYVYCNANPVKYVDPDGRENISFFDLSKADNQKLLNAVQKLPSNTDVIYFSAHGLVDKNSKKCLGIEIYDNKTQKSTYLRSACDLYLFLLDNSKVFKEHEDNNMEGSVVVLLSCSTGQEDAIAQDFSMFAEGSIVVAPSGNAFASPGDDGYKVSGVKPSSDGKSGVWNIYYKGELMECFEGNTIPVFKDPVKMLEKYEKMYQERHANEDN